MNKRQIRIKILTFFNFVPDELMIRIQYYIKLHRILHLKNPKRYTEKLQWYKLYYKNPSMGKCVDKFEVREYVKRHNCGHLLNDLIGIYDNTSDIDYEKFPNQFVIKDTLGGGSTSVIVVSDKDKIDINELNKTLNSWLNIDSTIKNPGREWVYENKKHRIIIENYLKESNGDLIDYKFFCFNGKVEYFYVRTDYAKNHEEGNMSFFDKQMNYLDGVGMDYCHISPNQIKLDKSAILEMIKYAEVLSKEFPHVRVDFYYVNNKVYFGELTFFNASGYMKFTPDSFDYTIGDSFEIENI